MKKLIDKIKSVILVIFGIQLAVALYMTNLSFQQIEVDSEIALDLEKDNNKHNYLLSAIQNLKQNLDSDAIQNIHIIKSDNQCEDGFQLLKLSSWFGTYEGCKSPMLNNIFLTDNFINICNPYAGDSIYKQIDQKDYYVWKGLSFCVQISSIEYKENTCDINFQKKCGNFCLDENLDCPISDIKILFANDPQLSSYQQNPSYSEIYSQEPHIFISRLSSSPPLISLSIFKGDSQCFIPEIIVESEFSVSNHVLMKQNVIQQSCGRYGGNQLYLDSDYEGKVLQENHIFQLLEGIPGIQEEIVKMNSFYRLGVVQKVVYTSDQCANTVMNQIINQIYPQQLDFTKYEFDSKWTLFICSIIQVFICVFSFIAWQIKQSFEILIDPFQTENLQPLLIGSLINQFIFILPIIIVNGILLSSVNDYFSNTLATIQKSNNNLNCFTDSFMNQILADIDNNVMVDYFNELIQLGNTVMVITLVQFVVVSVALFYVRKLYIQTKIKQA